MAWRITLENGGGELDRREVERPSHDKIKAAVREIVDDLAYFSDGDRIVVRDLTQPD